MSPGSLQPFDNTGRRRHEVAVREHAPLGRPGRAGRVDERREVVLFDRLGVEVPRQAPLRLELGEPVERDDLPQRRERAANGDELARLVFVLGEGEHCLAVREDVLALLRGARGVEADDHRADRHHRPVEKDPLEPGARQHRHPVALAHAAGEQSQREAVDALGRLVPRHGAPVAALLLLEVRGLVRRIANGVAPELGRGAPLHGLNRMQGRR